MKSALILIGLLLLSCSTKNTSNETQKVVDKKTVGLLPTEERPDLIPVAEFIGTQVTGVTVTNEGRLFANFPRWRKDVPFSVIEIKPDGIHMPYPNEDWNTWSGKAEKNNFISVQSVIAHGDSLYVLDTGRPEMKEMQGRPKLYVFDLKTDKLKRTYEFNDTVAPPQSYLNDLRVDERLNKVFITDSGVGGIVVLDMKTGEAKRVLDKHPSTQAENVTLTIDEKLFLTPDGEKPKIHSDGIALSPIDHKVYYHSLTGYQLYRIPAEDLGKAGKDQTQLVKKIEKLGVTPAPDGMIFDKKGNLYMADLERNAVAYRTPGGEMKILIQDERIKWPDSFTIDSENNLIFTDSHLQEARIGQPVDNMTFRIYKVPLPTDQ